MQLIDNFNCSPTVVLKFTSSLLLSHYLYLPSLYIYVYLYTYIYIYIYCIYTNMYIYRYEILNISWSSRGGLASASAPREARSLRGICVVTEPYQAPRRRQRGTGCVGLPKKNLCQAQRLEKHGGRFFQTQNEWFIWENR